VKGEIILRRLVGEELSAICFVMDYVEFHFNGPVLRAIANPVVIGPTRQWVFPQSGSRDALCSLIGTCLEDLVVEEDVHMSLRFDTGAAIRIPLDQDNRHLGEAVHLMPGNGQTVLVW
jgi:hypothetical protein